MSLSPCGIDPADYMNHLVHNRLLTYLLRVHFAHAVADLERAVTQSADGFRHETHVAINAVERVLELARRGVGAAVTTAKGGRDLVTATDVAVEDAVPS